MKKLTSIVCLMLLPQLAMADKLIGDMQSCQGLLDFLDTKLASPPAEYDAADVTKVRHGLNSYNAFIQSNVIAPRLAAASNAGSDAQVLQKQVNAFRQALVEQYQKRYPGQKLVMDHVVAIDNCSKKLMPTGQVLDDMKVSLKQIMQWAANK